MRAIFTKKIEEFAKENSNILMLTADLGWFFKSFREKFPQQFINCGVAEENMIGVASGLALSGKKVYCYSIIPFLIMKTIESIKVNVCLNDLNVVLMGGGGGLVYGKDGVTHQSIEDISLMRSLPNMTVVAPGDLLEAEALAKESISFQGPLYIRFGKDNAQVHNAAPDFKIGKGIILKQGRDVAIISCGNMLSEAKKTAGLLAQKGVNATLVSMHTIKPIDVNLLTDLAYSHKLIVTLEDHSIIGGLGSAVSEALPAGFAGLVKLALPDEYSRHVGDADYLYKCYGLDSQSVAEYIIRKI